jgi:hypothetical protein
MLNVHNEYTISYIRLLSVQRLFQCDYCECQQSVNDFLSYTFSNQWAALSHPSKADV